MVLMSVDLPQPFGPRMATCSPAPMLERDIVQHLLPAKHDRNVMEGEKRR